MDLNQILTGAAGLGSMAGAFVNADQIGATGEDLRGKLVDMGSRLAGDSQFEGYGVTTGLGSSTVASDGSMNLNVGPAEPLLLAGNSMYQGSDPLFAQAAGMAGSTNPAYDQAMGVLDTARTGVGANQGASYTASQQAILNSMMDRDPREQQIYDRAMAMQNPELNRMQAASRANEFAMGRTGVSGSQFGGSGEDAAMARARAEASNTAAFNAMAQAEQERMNDTSQGVQFGQLGNQSANVMNSVGSAMGNLGYGQGQLGQSGAGTLASIAGDQGRLGLAGYESAYTPMMTQLEAMRVAGADADRAQTGLLTGLGYESQLGLGGAQVNVNAENVRAQLMGNLYDSILDNLGGTSSTSAGSGSSNSGLIGAILGGL